MNRVAMFVTNPCTHDARVMKEAKTLADNGYEVRVFALANAFSDPGLFEQDGYMVHRLQFKNVFQRIQNIAWSSVQYALSPIQWVMIVIGWLLRKVAMLFGALSGLVVFGLRKLFRIHTPQDMLTSIRKDILEVDLSFSERGFLFFRRMRVGLNAWLKPRVEYEFRNNAIVKVDQSFLLLKKIRSLFRRIRSWVIKKVNKLIYSLFLPAHKISTYFFFCQSAAEAAISWEAKIAHAHDLNTMYAAHILKKKHEVSVIYDSHELWIHRNRVGRKAAIEKLVDRLVERWLIRDADLIVTVCDSIAGWLVDRYSGIPQPVILRNMPYGIMQDYISSADDFKSRLNIPDNRLTLIYTGKFTTGRGINVGLRLISKLEKFHFVMLGYGEERYLSVLEKQIDELDIRDKVTICPPVPYTEVTSFISGADMAWVYIEPICLSYEYALPNKLFESIQAGVPILGADLIEIRKVIDHYEIGACFKSENDLFVMLSKLNKEQVDGWRGNVIAVKEELCWEREAEVLLSCYESL